MAIDLPWNHSESGIGLVVIDDCSTEDSSTIRELLEGVEATGGDFQKCSARL